MRSNRRCHHLAIATCVIFSGITPCQWTRHFFRPCVQHFLSHWGSEKTFPWDKSYSYNSPKPSQARTTLLACSGSQASVYTFIHQSQFSSFGTTWDDHARVPSQKLSFMSSPRKHRDADLGKTVSKTCEIKVFYVIHMNSATMCCSKTICVTVWQSIFSLDSKADMHCVHIQSRLLL